MNSTALISKLSVLALCIVAAASASFAQQGVEGRKLLKLEGPNASVTYDLAGGSMADFHRTKDGVNPFTWNRPEKGDTAPRPMGHFICFDRWGQPSENEEKNGMPFHGEATSVNWSILSGPVKDGDAVSAAIMCALPMGGLTLTRTAKLSGTSPVLMVREVIKNVNRLGRVYNLVQHPSIAPEFLDESVIVDSNAWKGYLQESPWPTPEEPVVYWPFVVHAGTLVDLRRLGAEPNPAVTSFVFKDDVRQGWVTACNPGKGLMVGYVWDVGEYPWLNIWRNAKDGKPAARGLEFGTTGLHRPFKDMLEKHAIFGKTLCEYIDAGVSVEKSYVVFLAGISGNYRGVAELSRLKGKIVIRERGGSAAGDIVLTY
jgi:hypothetical protein